MQTLKIVPKHFLHSSVFSTQILAAVDGRRGRNGDGQKDALREIGPPAESIQLWMKLADDTVKGRRRKRKLVIFIEYSVVFSFFVNG